MGFRFSAFCFGLALAWSLSPSCSGSPSNSKLLYLVPPGAQIVAGFENYSDEHHHGQLVLTTRDNRLDLADWQAIAGVDHRRVIDEIVEVAASSVGGRLHEHLLLVSGRLDRDTIFRSLRLKGASEIEYQHLPVILVEPFARERGLMEGVRWLVILNDRLVLFGTPALVQSALSRYLNHADIDMVLRERLAQLPRNVSSWNVLSSLPKAPTEYTAPQPSNPWARFFVGADVLMVGVRFGQRIHVHFSLHAAKDRGAEFFEEKPASFAAVFAPRHTGSSRAPHIGDLEFGPDHVKASVRLSRSEFDAWSDWTNNFGHSPAVPEPGAATGQ